MKKFTRWLYESCGPMVEAFERELAEYTGIKHCAAVSSGTAAMHLALRGGGTRAEARRRGGAER